MSKKLFGVALLGCGTVGTGVFDLLRKRAGDIESRYGFEFEIRKILVRDPKKPRHGVEQKLITRDYRDIVADKSVDIIIEVMGGETPAKEYLMEALRSGRHVITANKALMGECGEKLVEHARKYHRFFGFSAAVTGFHHLIPSVVKSIMITELVGIFNGTSNYILTGLAKKPFDAVLSDAIRQGYAEADHRNDTDGYDTRNKLVLATRLAFGVFLDRDQIPVSGINGIQSDDIQHAAELGFTIKLLGAARLVEENHLTAFVAPALVPDKDPLAKVNGVNNAIIVSDKFRGVQSMSAAGAGKDVTAMAVFSDLLSLARDEDILWPPPAISRRHLRFTKNLPPAEHYVRVNARNVPGVLAVIAKHFARHGINIDEVSQRASGVESTVSIVFILGITNPKSIYRALAELLESKSIVMKPIVLRIERSPFQAEVPELEVSAR